MSNEVDLGLRIFLDDMLSSGLSTIRNGMSSLASGLQSSTTAAAGFADKLDELAVRTTDAQTAAVGITDAMALTRLEYDGNAASLGVLEDEYSAMVSEQIQITSQLEALSNATNGFTTTTQAQDDEINRLNNTYRTNNQFMAQNEAEASKLDNVMQGQLTTLDALQGKLDANSDAQNSYAASTAIASSNLDDATASASAFTAGLNGISAAIGGGVDLLLFGGALDFSVKSASSLQDAMAGVQITLNATDAQMQAMGQTITTVASNSIFSSAEVAQAFSMLGDRGATVTSIINGLGQASIELAEAIGSDTTPAADILGKTMQVFGASTDQATYYASALTFAFHNGLPSVSDLSTSLNQTAGIAKQLNIPINELVVTLDYLTQNGVQAGTAASSLRYMMQSLIDPTAKTNQELSDLGIITMNKATPAFTAFEAKLASTGKTASNLVSNFDGTVTGLQGLYNEAKKMGTLNTNESFNQWATSIGMVGNKLYNSKGQLNDWFVNLQTIGNSLKGKTQQEFNTALGNLFNVRSGQGGDVLLKNIDSTMQSIDKLNAKFNTFTGGSVPGVLKAAAERSDTLSGEMKKLTTTFQTFGASIIGPVIQPLASFVGSVNSLMSKVSGGSTTMSTFGSVFLATGAILSTVVVIIGVMAAMTAIMGGALIPIISIAAGVAFVIGTVAAGIALVVTGIQQGNPWMVLIGGTLTALGIVILAAFIPSLISMAAGFFTAAAGAWALMLPFLPIIAIILGVAAVIAIIIVVVQHWGAIAHWLQGVWGAVVGWLSGIWKAVQAAWNIQLKLLSQVFQTVWNAMITALKWVGNLFKSIFTAIVGVLKWFYDHNYYVKEFVDGVTQGFSLMGKLLKQWWAVTQALFTAAGAALKAAWDHITKGIHDDLVVPFMNLMGMIGNIVNNGWNIVKGGFNAFNTWVLSWAPGVLSNIGKGFSNFGSWLHDHIVKPVDDLGNTLLQSGKNFMQMLANGIAAGAGLVWDQIKNVAAGIWKNLGFHSPTKEGVLSDSDTWMPNMMRMFGVGIESGIPTLQSSVSRIANTLSPGSLTHPNGAALSSGAYGGSGSSSTINMVVDGKVLTSVVLDHTTNTLKMNGSGRTLK